MGFAHIPSGMDVVHLVVPHAPARQLVTEQEHNSATTLVLVQQLVAAYLQHNVASRSARSLSVNEDLVLMHLATAPATSAELCRRIGISSASMAHIVAGLDARGLLRRLPDEADKRRILLYASKAAIAGFDDPELAKRIEQLMDGFTKRERSAVRTALREAADLLAD